MQQQSVEGESEDEESDVHSDTDDDSSSSDDQLEVEVITDIDDFLLNFQNFLEVLCNCTLLAVWLNVDT